MKSPKAKPVRTIGSTNRDNILLPESTEQKGDLLIRDLWQNGTDSVQDMSGVNTDTKSYSGKQPEKCVQKT